MRFGYPASTFALRIDALHIRPGEKVAIVGPSGSGKTTLLNLVSGISIPNSGRIVVHGLRIDVLNDRARRNFRIATIGFVFQQFELIPYLRLVDNVLLPYFINPRLKLNREVRARADELIARLGLGGKERRYMHELSQGEQQRVAVCRALVGAAPLILADEPTGNLDPANKRSVLQLLFEESDRAGQTLLAVTHDTAVLDGFDRTIDFSEFHAVGAES
ncbi:MAG TPA: ABC transporter ATP-binding protein [Pirellulaceae bacterium]|nr:ABC transporter ATP-binding protein [Pirellulaceae bacterium]